MSQEEIYIDFHNISQLYEAYMPYLKSGGLFIKTTKNYSMGQELTLNVTLPDALESETISGSIVWTTPQATQSSMPCGVGLAFGEDKKRMQSRIEKMLGSKLNSADTTFTL
jgi:type IV pilus assembly protein PilZ